MIENSSLYGAYTEYLMGNIVSALMMAGGVLAFVFYAAVSLARENTLPEEIRNKAASMWPIPLAGAVMVAWFMLITLTVFAFPEDVETNLPLRIGVTGIVSVMFYAIGCATYVGARKYLLAGGSFDDEYDEVMTAQRKKRKEDE